MGVILAGIIGMIAVIGSWGRLILEQLRDCCGN